MNHPFFGSQHAPTEITDGVCSILKGQVPHLVTDQLELRITRHVNVYLQARCYEVVFFIRGPERRFASKVRKHAGELLGTLRDDSPAKWRLLSSYSYAQNIKRRNPSSGGYPFDALIDELECIMHSAEMMENTIEPKERRAKRAFVCVLMRELDPDRQLTIQVWTGILEEISELLGHFSALNIPPGKFELGGTNNIERLVKVCRQRAKTII